jgi:hypothetical protein
MLSIKIREANFEDAEVISRLSTQLGYPANEMDIQNNLWLLQVRSWEMFLLPIVKIQ